MGKSRRPSDRGQPTLSEEDRAAWEQTARTLKPIRRARQGATPSREAVAPSPPKPRAPPRPAPPPPPSDDAPAFAEIGRRQVRKLGAGRARIDARVDLHGMTRAKAHGVLREFLFSAQARGARWVLVITGKGAPRTASPESDDDHFAPTRAPGVLRREVPTWLNAPELKPMIVGFREAAIEHGGEGALYVHLRQRTR